MARKLHYRIEAIALAQLGAARGYGSPWHAPPSGAQGGSPVTDEKTDDDSKENPRPSGKREAFARTRNCQGARALNHLFRRL